MVPTGSSTTAAQGAHASESDRPLQQHKAKVTTQLVVNTGNIQIMMVASLEDTLVGLEKDYMKK